MSRADTQLARAETEMRSVEKPDLISAEEARERTDEILRSRRLAQSARFSPSEPELAEIQSAIKNHLGDGFCLLSFDNHRNQMIQDYLEERGYKTEASGTVTSCNQQLGFAPGAYDLAGNYQHTREFKERTETKITFKVSW